MDRQQLRQIGKRADKVGADRQLRHSMRREPQLWTSFATAACVAISAFGLVLLILTFV